MIDSHFEKYRKELNAENLTSLEDLEKLIKTLIKTATKIEVQAASRPPENSQLQSHFGGQPYFEEDEQWATNEDGRPLDFIFQIFNNDEIELPDSIRLVQFFYDWEEFPWDSADSGWFVKIYQTLNTDKLISIEKPSELEKSKFCEIKFKPVESLPDWEGIDLYSLQAGNLSCVLDEDEPWGNYLKAVEKLIGEQDYQSQLSGYPKWVQGESTPQNEKGDTMKLLFQIDSEDNAGLMWGDVGLIYVFYDEESKSIEFILQCY